MVVNPKVFGSDIVGKPKDLGYGVVPNLKELGSDKGSDMFVRPKQTTSK